MRYYDWPERLFEAIKVARNTKFQWGKHDCAIFAFDCAKAMTGVDYTKSFRGTYDTRLTAMKVLRRIEKVDGLSGLADKYLGENISLTSAQRGDVVLFSVDSTKALGVIVGSHAVFLSENGIRSVPLIECQRAWRIE